MRISRDPRNTPPGPVMAIRFAAIPVVLLSVHGATVATVSSPSPAARATATAPVRRGPRPHPRPRTGRRKGKAASPTAPARLPRVPGLRISIGDGRTTAQVGDRLTYTVLVQNSGARKSPPLKITQTLPPGLRFVSASSHGIAKAGSVTWHADLPAGGKDTFSLQAQVTQHGRPAVAAGRCCLRGPGRQPYANRLRRPPGPAARRSGRRLGPPGRRPATSTLPSYAAGILAVLAAAVLVIVAGLRVRVRRRRAG